MKRFILQLVFLCGILVVAQGQVKFNEVQSSNATTQLDPDFFKYKDWIELYNTSSSTFDLSGCYITDNKDKPRKWQIPSGQSIAGGKYLIIYCDGEDVTGRAMHTNFKLSASGDVLFLYSSTMLLLDSVKIGTIETDYTYGRLTNGTGKWAALSKPTPGAANVSTIVKGLAPKPVFSIAGGYYNKEQSVSLSTDLPGAVIRYTTDGSEPTESSPVYSGPITAKSTTAVTQKYGHDRKDKTGIQHYAYPSTLDYPNNKYTGNRTYGCVIKAKVFHDDYVPSNTEANTYFININRRSLPVVSISTDFENFFNKDTGIYIQGVKGLYDGYVTANWRQDWERKVFVEYFDENGNRQFGVSAGATTMGAVSRNYDMKSLNIVMKKKYEDGNMNYPLFGDDGLDTYKSFVLRNAGNDWEQGGKIRDAAIQQVLRGQIDLETQDVNPVVMYLNGEYWGFINMRERYDEDYFAGYHDYADDIDLLKWCNDSTYNFRASKGDTQRLGELLAYLAANSMKNTENYEYVKAHYIDVDNMINYYIAQFFCQNTDWPTNNMRMWRPRTENGKFRFPWYDTDFGYGLWGGDAYTDPWDNFDKESYKKKTSVALLNYMLENEEFKADFVQRFYAMMATLYQYDRFKTIATDLDNKVSSERSAMMDEWTCTLNDGETWGYGLGGMKNWAKNRVASMEDHVNDKFDKKGTTTLKISYTQSQGQVYVCTIPVDNGYSAKHQKSRAIRLLAEPKDGYTFSSWKNGNTVVSTNPEYFATITAETTLTAVFESRSTEKNLYINEFLTSNSTDAVDDANEHEDWIEIYNGGSSSVNLAGLYLSDDSTNLTKYQIPYGHYNETTIASKGFVVFWADNDSQDGALHLPFKLDRSSGAIYLSQKGTSGTVTTIDKIKYLQQNTDVSYGRYPDGNSNLTIFTQTTPGTENIIPSATYVDGLVINEFMSKNNVTVREETGTYADWFEIYNTTSKDIDLGGLFVTNDLSNPTKYMIPKGESAKTTVKAGGYYMFWCDKQTAINPNHVDFKLNAESGDIAIVQLRGSESYIIDQVSYSNQGQDISYGRYPNATGDFKYLLTPTPNAVNVNTSSIVAVSGVTINEVLALNTSIVADEEGSYGDYIEFYNGTNSAIDLGGLFISDSAGYSLRCRIPTTNSAATTVQSGKWITFWADGKPELGANHLDFSLDGENGEDVVLSQIDGDGNIITIDQISFGPQTENISYGRYPEKEDNWEAMSPTYGARNQSVNSSVALKTLTASAGTILPAVSTSVLAYECSVPAGTEVVPTISATTVHDKASVIITQAATLDDEAIVKVISANGFNSETYKVSFKIAASADATLAVLELGGGTLSPAFSPDTYKYTANLTTTYVPYLTAIANDEHAMVDVVYAETVAGTTVITVTAESGATQRYEITYAAAESQNIVTEWSDDFTNGIGNVTPVTEQYKATLQKIETKTGAGPGAVTTVNNKLGVSLSQTGNESEFGYIEYHLPTGYVLDGSSALNVSMNIVSVANGKTLNGVTVDNEYIAFNVAVVDVYGNVSDYVTYATTINSGTNEVTSINFSTASYITKSAIVAVRMALNGPSDSKKERHKAAYIDDLVIGPKTSTGNTEAVVLSDNAELASLSVNVGTLSPAFSDDTKEYTVTVPAGTTTIPTISATAVDDNAFLEITQASDLNGTAHVRVISQDLVTVNDFTINFELTPDVVDGYTDYVISPAMKGWSESSSLYSMAYNGGDVAVAYNRTSALSEAIDYNCVAEDSKILDLTDNPYVSVKLKSTVATSLFVELYDGDGNTTSTSLPAAAITAGSEMGTYTFDLTGKFGSVDKTDIRGMKLYFDKGSATHSSGTITIDELRFGKDVEISVNNAPVWNDIADQIIQQGDSFTNINLQNFVSDDNTDVANLIFELENASENLTISITSGILSTQVKDAAWIGSETIKVKATDADGAYSVTSINFGVEEAKIDLTAVSFSQSSIVIQEGQTKDLSTILTYEPSNATIESIVWSVADESSATINGAGVITNILDFGTENNEVTVVVTDKSGNKYTKTITAVLTGCPTAVSLVSTEATKTMYYNETAQLSYTLSPSNACVKSVAYSTSDASIATVSETGLITAQTTKGDATITISVNDGFSVKTATCKISVSKDCSGDIELKLNKESLSLVAGSYLQLVATITPADECTEDNVVTWTSSNSLVATVSNGIVNAVSDGTATITASTTGTGTTTATCVVKVSPNCTSGPVEVVMASKEASMFLSSDLTLSAEITTENPCNSELVWSSSDETVATVEDGVVTPKKYGTTVIRATAVQDADSYDECTLTVEENKVTAVEVSAQTKMMYVGATQTMTATLTPDDADNKTIMWMSSAPEIAAVSSKGVVTALASGNVSIYAVASSGISDFYTIQIVDVEVQDITLNISSVTLNVGDNQQISASFMPENATNQSLTFTSNDESIVTVSETGLISAVAEGKTTVVVTTKNNISKIVSITVNSDGIAVEKVEVTPTSLDMFIGDTETLTETVTPDDATNKTITWSSSDKSVATVSSTGVVTAIGQGDAVITASSANNKTADVDVHVSYRAISSASFNTSSVEVAQNKSVDLSKLLVLNPAATETESIVWNVNSTNATVDVDGELVNNLDFGTETATVTATVTDMYGTSRQATVQVVLIGCPTKVTAVTLNMYSVEITKTQTAQLSTTTVPQNACVQSISYTSANPAIATVSSLGKITPVAVGKTTVTVTVNDGYSNTIKEVAVEVLKDVVAVETVELSQSALIKYIGDKFQLTATVSPDDATNSSLSWTTTDKSVATVDESGNVQILAAGTVTISATAHNGVSASCVITAKSIDVTSVSLIPQELTMQIYDTEQLIATVSPANATIKTVSWNSSNDLIAEVDNNGVVTAKKAGTCQITAVSNNGKTATCVLTVTDIEPTSIKVEPTVCSLNIDETKEITVTLQPSNVTDTTLTWESNNATVATVKDGVITAVGAGQTQVTVTTGNDLKKTIMVTVNPMLAQSITLNTTTATLLEGEQQTLIATVLPAKTTNKSVTWKSSNNSVAAVDANGKITAGSIGEAIITATTSNGLEASCTVNVTLNVVGVTKVETNPSSMTLYIGETSSVEAVITPSNATNKAIVWSSDKTSIATVDQYGTVTAVSEGVATITATSANNISGTCLVTVKPIEVEALKLSNVSLAIGESQTLNVVITPSNVTDKTIRWSVDNESIATINANTGKITGVAEGTTFVTATASNGVSVSAEVSVLATAIELQFVTAKTNIVYINIDDSEDLSSLVEFYPANATNKALQWEVTRSNPTYETGDVVAVSNGIVTGLRAGSATVKFTAKAASSSASLTVVVNPINATGLTLNKTATEIVLGNQEKLTATITPSNVSCKTIKWQTSNVGVAYVTADGTVNAVGVGTAVITAQTSDKSGLTASCTVSVINQPITKLIPNVTSLNLIPGQMTEVTLSVEPEDANTSSIVWSSSNGSVVAVDKEGGLTAKDFGTAVITATASSGVSCQVTVTVAAKNNPPVLFEPIEDQTINAGESFATIKLADHFVDDKTTELIWSVDAGGDNIKITVTGSGVATITVVNKKWSGSQLVTFYAADKEGAKTPASVMLTVIGNGDPEDPQAVENVELESLKAFPNPTDGITTIHFETASAEDCLLEIYSESGRKIYSQMVYSAGEFNQLYDLSGNVKGVYYVVVTIGNEQKRVPVILK